MIYNKRTPKTAITCLLIGSSQKECTNKSLGKAFMGTNQHASHPLIYLAEPAHAFK